MGDYGPEGAWDPHRRPDTLPTERLGGSQKLQSQSSAHPPPPVRY